MSGKTIGGRLAECGTGAADPVASARTVSTRPNGVAVVLEEIRWGAGRTSIRVTAGHERLNLLSTECVRLGVALLAAGERE